MSLCAARSTNSVLHSSASRDESVSCNVTDALERYADGEHWHHEAAETEEVSDRVRRRSAVSLVVSPPAAGKTDEQPTAAGKMDEQPTVRTPTCTHVHSPAHPTVSVGMGMGMGMVMVVTGGGGILTVVTVVAVTAVVTTTIAAGGVLCVVTVSVGRWATVTVVTHDGDRRATRAWSSRSPAAGSCTGAGTALRSRGRPI